ncbi:MAG: carboxypeptidase Taq, partial [Halieaceae bacterium]
MGSYEKLESHFTGIADLNHVSSILSWDEAAMMPAGGGEARASASATLAVLIHQRSTDPALLDWIAEAENEAGLNEWQRANVREIKRDYSNNICLPGQFVDAQSRACARSEQAWRTMRADNNWEGMRPLLEEVVVLAREEASLRSAGTGLSAYDSLLNLYEPGVTCAEIDIQFAPLREFLPGFLNTVLERQASEPIEPLGNSFSVAKQRELGLEMMAVLGFDFEHGRLDVSHHPFCGGVPDDVRITTRYREDNFLDSLMGVLHETGHALYEQGLPHAWRHQPVGTALGSAEHESQSLLMEMQACRSREFVKFLAPIAQRIMAGPDAAAAAWGVDNLYRHYTRVHRGFIRVDADEVTYPLHVILRYEIEKSLIEGEVEVSHIPELWNDKMQSYLGLNTRGNFTDGCLQDVHWPCGLFGYFPTYSLGAMTAAQLFSAANRDRPSILNEIEEGDFSHLLAWLRTNVHNKGSLLSATDMLTSATGSSLDANYFIDHLKRR